MSRENPYVHEIHVSEIRLFKKCRFAHVLKFVGMLYPKTTAKPLEFGTAYHAAKQVFYDPQTNGYPADARKELAILRFVQVCNEQKDALGNGITEEEKADYAERIELGVGMLEYYFSTVAPVEDINMEPMAVEQNFSVPIVNPETGEPLMCKCDKCWDKIDQTDFDEEDHPTEAARRAYWDGLPVHLEGQIDLILRDLRNNKVWVLDWKTTARMADRHEWLELDEQVVNYHLLLPLQ